MVRHESLETNNWLLSVRQAWRGKIRLPLEFKNRQETDFFVKILPFLNSVLASVLYICWLTAENLSSLLWHAFEHQPIQNTKVTFPPVTTTTMSPPVSKDCYPSPFFHIVTTAELLSSSNTAQPFSLLPETACCALHFQGSVSSRTENPLTHDSPIVSFNPRLKGSILSTGTVPQMWIQTWFWMGIKNTGGSWHF